MGGCKTILEVPLHLFKAPVFTKGLCTPDSMIMAVF